MLFARFPCSTLTASLWPRALCAQIDLPYTSSTHYSTTATLVTSRYSPPLTVLLQIAIILTFRSTSSPDNQRCALVPTLQYGHLRPHNRHTCILHQGPKDKLSFASMCPPRRSPSDLCRGIDSQAPKDIGGLLHSVTTEFQSRKKLRLLPQTAPHIMWRRSISPSPFQLAILVHCLEAAAGQSPCPSAISTICKAIMIISTLSSRHRVIGAVDVMACWHQAIPHCRHQVAFNHSLSCSRAHQARNVSGINQERS